MASSPSLSTSSRLRATPATAASTVILPSTAAKSRTLRNSRPATRGVPRDRRAISADPSAVMSMFSSLAARATMRCNSSGV